MLSFLCVTAPAPAGGGWGCVGARRRETSSKAPKPAAPTLPPAAASRAMSEVLDYEFPPKICCLGAGYVGGPTMTVMAQMCPDVKVRG